MSDTANNTVVLKADATLQAKLKSFYADSFCEKTPQYAVFRAKCEDCTVTLYTSGKVMFQGKRAGEEAAVWEGGARSAECEARSVQCAEQSAEGGFADTTAVGSDEVGTGDFFGPVVVTASYVKETDFAFLRELGVCDSKRLTDEKIRKIAPQLMENIPHATHICSNTEYNALRKRGINMNQLKALYHNECLFKIKKESGCGTVVVDQFEPPQAYYRHIAGEADQVKDIIFMTKAEDKCLAVAVSSVISRFLFLEEMEKMARQLGVDEVPLGAGPGVDAFGAQLMRERGDFIFEGVAKLNFANLEKIKALV